MANSHATVERLLNSSLLALDRGLQLLSLVALEAGDRLESELVAEESLLPPLVLAPLQVLGRNQTLLSALKTPDCDGRFGFGLLNLLLRVFGWVAHLDEGDLVGLLGPRRAQLINLPHEALSLVQLRALGP